jgi:hypothetical protein
MMEAGSVTGDNAGIAEARAAMEEEAALAPSGSGNTLLDGLRRLRDEAGSQRHEDFPVPGYRGRVVIRAVYSSDLWDRFKVIAKRVEKSKSQRKELYAQADSIVLATEQIMVIKDGEPRPLGEAFPEFVPTPEDREMPISWGDPVLCEMFDLRRPDGSLISSNENHTQREVLLAFFNNPLAVTNTHNQIAEWLQGSSEDDEVYLGESSAATR